MHPGTWTSAQYLMTKRPVVILIDIRPLIHRDQIGVGGYREGEQNGTVTTIHWISVLYHWTKGSVVILIIVDTQGSVSTGKHTDEESQI